MSGFFQGYAQMMSSVGWRRDSVWSHGHGGGKPWGRSFKVKWLRLHDLPFQKTLHLKNPLNQYKPVKISRDCQVCSVGMPSFLVFFELSFVAFIYFV
jgi:YTH domain-containing protein 1